MEEDESFGPPLQIPMNLNGLSLRKKSTKEEALFRRRWNSSMGFGKNELSLCDLLPITPSGPVTLFH